MLADHQLVQEMKRDVVSVVINAEPCDLEIFRFVKVARSVVYKDRKELYTENGNLSPLKKGIKRFKTPDND